ncbi:HNH endonuclease [Flavobacterium sp. MFBS3-15]|uniref:HNH endonuclease n=1 Tax=Flavobacterium sp. MFBS3-15 TaxID=2989816 RepID=UPI002235929E|nr:HNH endonuclease [Flavobacterium sp. MFBS3-15]MCW4469137.1 HNH endonuclease [Flavobacterium sp. MFBS3-15]
MNERIFEEDLRLPALYLISMNNGKLNTTQLSNLLRTILKPSGEDLELLANRNDDYFSQIVRNLTAKTRSFVKNGFIQRESKSGSPFFITDKGKIYLEQNKPGLKYLLSNDFDYVDIKENLKSIEKGKKIETFDENIIISEGLKIYTERSVYERSKKLRGYAIDYFSQDGRISCNCCSFNFEDFYGIDCGKGFIEIHHTKPIFKYEEQDINTTIEQAMKNLIPVCSNCHRMIHRNWAKPIEIQVLINTIQQNGIINGHKII